MRVSLAGYFHAPRFLSPAILDVFSSSPRGQPTTTAMSSLTTYTGSCHCGANRFEVALPKLTSALACSCKLCFKNHLLWTFPDDGALTITRGGEDTLVKYNSAALEEEVSS